MNRTTFESSFNGRKVEEKLVIMFMVITMFALLIAGLGYRWHQIRVHKFDLVDDLYTYAGFLALNSAAALRFNVPKDTEELLSSLASHPSLRDAVIYDQNGQLFASYPPRDAITDPFLDVHQNGVVFTLNEVRVVQAIIHDEDNLGTLVLVSDLSGMYASIRESFFVAAALFTMCLLISLLLARSSVRIVSRPITSLVETSQRISLTGDYSIRAQKFHDDDLGHLTDQFNEMLKQIESREHMLHEEQAALQESQQREAELQDQLARSERLESLGLLAGGIAHDLNNILGPLVAYPDLVLEQLPDDSPVRDDLRQMQQAADKAAHVIQDLLTLGRRGNFDRQPVQINDVVCEFTHSAAYHALLHDYPKTSIRLELASDVPYINGSRHHLTQVVMNLALNAVEAMPDGGALVIRTRPVGLTEPLSGMEIIPVGDYVQLSFKDEGVGISKEDLSHIFEPFYTRKVRGRSGSGLGLSVVYGILKDLDGFVDLQSTPGKGALFSFYIPVSTKEHVQPEAEKPDVKGSERILVLDDVEQQRVLADRILSSLGYTVDTVGASKDALDAARSTHYDVIVLDMILAENQDGLDTFREIRKMQPAQRCIIASGFSESERVHSAEAEGASAFVAKPYSREGLASAIRKSMESV